MSKVYLEDSVLTDIADSIRAKTQKSGLITPANMPNEIESISGGSGSITLNYLDGIQSPSNLAPDPYMTTILANRNFDDIKIWVHYNDYKHSFTIIDKNTCVELTNVTFNNISGNNISGKVYIPTSSIIYNNSYGTYEMINVTWGDSVSNIIYNLFVPNNSTDCYWFSWYNAQTFNLSQKDTAFTLVPTGNTSGNKIRINLGNPYGGSFSSERKNRFWWIVEE